MTRYLALFCISLLFWLLLSWSLELVSIVSGIVVAIITSLIFGKHFYSSTYKLMQWRRYLMVFPFFYFFTIECIKANFDLAWRVIQYKIPIKPAIIKVPLSLETDLARAVLSCALTMTPGTIVIDIIEDDIYIHWIDINKEDPYGYAQIKISRFEKYIKTIFD